MKKKRELNTELNQSPTIINHEKFPQFKKFKPSAAKIIDYFIGEEIFGLNEIYTAMKILNYKHI